MLFLTTGSSLFVMYPILSNSLFSKLFLVKQTESDPKPYGSHKELEYKKSCLLKELFPKNNYTKSLFTLYKCLFQ